MADSKDTYTAQEIDIMLENMKRELLDHIDNQIIMEMEEEKPSPADTSLWLKITEIEVD